MYGVKENTWNLIVNEIKKNAEIESAIIFGSRAKGNYLKGSDIDIALKGKSITDSLLTRLSRRINMELPIPYKVDLILYERLTNKNLIDHINECGKVIH